MFIQEMKFCFIVNKEEDQKIHFCHLTFIDRLLNILFT